MTNRFLEMNDELQALSAPTSYGQWVVNNAPRYGGWSGAHSAWSTPFAAADRVLVILIENKGVDLGIPDLVKNVMEVLPGSSVIPDSVKRQMEDSLRDTIKKATDSLLEGFELSVNRYASAKPGLFGDVIVLRDSSATYADLKRQLVALSKAGKIIDVIVLTHGNAGHISAQDDIDAQKIKDIKAENGAPLTIRSVYMMNCVGSSLNKAWLDAGAKVSSGSIGNNYLPEPTMFFFWKAWKEGTPFGTAATGAYQKTVDLMNGAIRGFINGLPIPGTSALASKIDVKTWDFVKQSAPRVEGDGSVTISSDALSFSKSLSDGMAVTVVPVSVLESLAATPAGVAGPPPRRTVSAFGIELLKGWDSFHQSLYADASGRCAIGYGSVLHMDACDGRPIEEPYAKGVTTDKATELLTREADDAQQVIHATVSVPLSQTQHDALVSFVSDVGGRGFKDSTLLRLLNEGHYEGVPAEIRKWTKARRNGEVVELPELARRRNAEANMFAGAAAPAVSTTSSLEDSFGFGMEALDVNIKGTFYPIKQPSPATSWAAAIAMMYTWWKDAHGPISIPEALAVPGQEYVDWFVRGEAIDGTTASALYSAVGLKEETPFNPTLQHWADLIRTYGPLYVDVGAGASGTIRPIIVVGLLKVGGPAGEGAASIRFADPSEGQFVDKPFQDFLRIYAPGGQWPHRIVRWGPKTGAAPGVPIGRSSSYSSPSSVTMSPSDYSVQQNPAVLIAGLEVADAAALGLAAIGLVQAQVSASQGSFSLSYDKAARMLTTEARAQMPGAQSTKKKYTHHLFYLQIARWNTAKADVIIEWEGNPYGEIGTPIIRRELATSTEWSKSSANTTITKVDRIPLPGTDPRTWPISYSYEGTFDPMGNGYFEFSGEFEINAFGGLKFTRHEVVSRSLADFALGGTPEGKVQRGADSIVPVPAIPQEQIAYLRTRLP